MRTETEERLKILQEQYWGKKENAEVGPKIREKYKQYATEPASSSPTTKSSKKGATTPGILKTKGDKAPKGGKGLSTVDVDDGGEERESLAKPKFNYKNLKKGSRSRSKSVKQRSEKSPEEMYSDPRQQIYEAKFEKYLANKKAKEDK